MIKNRIVEKVNDERLICNALRVYHQYRMDHAIDLMKQEDYSYNSNRLFILTKEHEEKFTKLNRILQRKCK